MTVLLFLPDGVIRNAPEVYAAGSYPIGTILYDPHDTGTRWCRCVKLLSTGRCWEDLYPDQVPKEIRMKALLLT